MKRVCCIILSVLLLLALFAGCKEDTNSPVTASVASMDGESGEKVIRILTDLGHNAELATDVPPTVEQAQESIDEAMKKLEVELPAGFRVEVEMMPTEEVEFQTALTRLRAEIMAGKGPDIYVLSTRTLAGFYPQECLFPDAQMAMRKGYFLKLDDYMDKAKFMEFEDMNPTVMEAGCTPEGRFALPMRYTFKALKTSEPVTNTEAGWFDVIHGSDAFLAEYYAIASDSNFTGVFPQLIDYDTKTLLFTEEELYDAVSTILELEIASGDDPFYSETTQNLWIGVDLFGPGANGWGRDSAWDPERQEGAVYIPMRNRDGGVSANVTSFIAIGSNTAYPDEAFQIVDMMMGKKFQSGEKFWLGKNGGLYAGDMLRVFSWSLGVSVYNDFLQESRPMHYIQYLDDSMFPVWCELRDKITDARILGSFDEILVDMPWHLRVDGMTPGDEMKKYVAQEYRKMVLMAGEL